MGDEQGAVHSRTFTWHDPDETVRAGRTMSGLDLLRAILAGELPRPPIAALMGFAFSEVEEGRITDADGKLYAHATTTCLIMRG